MAFAFVDDAHNSNTSTSDISVSYTPASSDNVLVCAMWSRDTPSFTNDPTSYDAKWTVINEDYSTWGQAAMYYGTGFSGTISSVRWTLSGPKRVLIWVAEFSYDTSKTLILETPVYYGAQSAETDVTLNNANGVMVSGAGYFGNDVMASTDGSNTVEMTDANSWASQAFGYRILTGITPSVNYDFDWDQSGATNTCCILAEQDAAGGATQPRWHRAGGIPGMGYSKPTIGRSW